MRKKKKKKKKKNNNNNNNVHDNGKDKDKDHSNNTIKQKETKILKMTRLIIEGSQNFEVLIFINSHSIRDSI